MKANKKKYYFSLRPLLKDLNIVNPLDSVTNLNDSNDIKSLKWVLIFFI